MADTRRQSTPKEVEPRDRIILFLPVVLTVAFICLKLVSLRAYAIAVQEDHIIEYVQGALYLAAAIVAFITAFRLLRTSVTITTLLYLCFALVLLLGFLEEISWGQRLLSIDSTEFFLEHNDQREINLHNLDPIEPFLHSLFVLVGFYGAFAWLVVPKRITRGNDLSYLLVPPPTLMFYFIPAMLFYAYWELGVYVFSKFCTYAEYTYSGWMNIRDQESAELLLALGLFFFAMINNRKTAASYNLMGRKSNKTRSLSW